MTGDAAAEMRWSLREYREKIILRHGVVLSGWPRSLPFRNLSSLQRSATAVRELLELFEEGKLRFRRARAGEIIAAREGHYNACLGPIEGCQEPLVKVCRSDSGEHRERASVDSKRFPPRYVRKGPKSKRWIDSDSE